MKTRCTFLPLAAICRKIKHSFISFLFHVPATLKDETVLSGALMQDVWAVKIYATFWLILSASFPSDLQFLQELGEGLGHCLSKKAHSHGSDLVVQLGVDCSRDVDICLQNSRGRFIDFKLSVCVRLLLNFAGFVARKWLQ